MSHLDEVDYEGKMNLELFKKAIKFLSAYKTDFFVAVLVTLLQVAIDVSYPLFQKYALDNYILKGSLEGIYGFVLLYISLILIQVVCLFIFAVRVMRMEMLLGKDLKRSCFLKLQELSFSYYNQTPVGYIHTRIMSDTLKIPVIFTWQLLDFIWQFFYVAGVFIAMFMLNYRLASIVVLVVPFFALLTWFFQNKLLKYNRLSKKENSKITNSYSESIMGDKTSKTLVIRDKTYDEFKENTNRMKEVTFRGSMIRSIYVPIIALISTIVVAIILSTGSEMVINNIEEIGTLSVFVTFAISIFQPIQTLSTLMAEFISTGANIERVFDLIEQDVDISDSPEILEKYGTVFEPKCENYENITGDIEFKNVWFMYPDGHEYILEDFSLKIKAGTTVAIVGETGAGKSTLVNLACRFFEPTKGQILIDGVDYKERSISWLHSNIGYVLQNPHLFSGTVKENIRYGKLDASDAEIEEACKVVMADVVINKLENGFDSLVYESGGVLSTGEKQLISFARAILTDPKIFVLDEATSSVDTKTEDIIKQAVNNVLENRTSFVIAHRLSTIVNSDIILMISDGKIVERGSHKDLMSKKGSYYNLYKNQFEEEKMTRVLKK